MSGKRELEGTGENGGGNEKKAKQNDRVPSSQSYRSMNLTDSHDGRVDGNLPPVFMLTSEVFWHVLAFLERSEVAGIMKLTGIRRRYQMRESFCPVHGTRLGHIYSTSDTERDCVDCCVEECGSSRCDRCGSFASHPIFSPFFDGPCGKWYCGDCYEPTICGICYQSRHVGCGQCEALMSCGQCEVILTCTVCNDEVCGRCSTEKQCACGDILATECEYCYWPVCGVCNKGSCPSCPPIHFCDYCYEPSHVDCGQSDAPETCAMCTRKRCFNCRSCTKRQCSCGDVSLCWDCSDEWFVCQTCEKGSCPSCRSIHYCDKCGGVFCEDCREFKHFRYDSFCHPCHFGK